MKYEQKFGVAVMVAALLLGLLAISISDNWDTSLGAVQNLMLRSKIRLFPDDDSPRMSWTEVEYAIDVHTKYVLLGLVAVGAYGFLTYLNITPAWKKKSAAAPPATASSPMPPDEAGPG